VEQLIFNSLLGGPTQIPRLGFVTSLANIGGGEKRAFIDQEIATVCSRTVK
jgi:hypothetical protein